MPNIGEIVCNLEFFTSGFGLPLSGSFLTLLRFYGVELTHLDPYAMVVLSVFMHLCEAYLRIRPELDLLRAFFYMTRAS